MMRVLLCMIGLWMVVTGSLAGSTANGAGPVYEVRPIGWVRKVDGRTTIEVDKHYPLDAVENEALLSL